MTKKVNNYKLYKVISKIQVLYKSFLYIRNNFLFKFFNIFIFLIVKKALLV